MPTVAQLRAELKKRGLDTSGLKAVLEARLEEAKASEAAPPEPEVPAPESRKRARGNDAAQEGYHQEIDGVGPFDPLFEIVGGDETAPLELLYASFGSRDLNEDGLWDGLYLQQIFW